MVGRTNSVTKNIIVYIISVSPNVDAILACKLWVTVVPSGFQVGIPTLGAFFDKVADWEL